jgi:hypothetical protein
VAALFTTRGSLFLWERLSPLQPLQFPWRFLELISLGTAFLCGFPLLLLAPERHRLANILMVALIAVLLVTGFPHAKPQTFLDITDADFSPQNISIKGIAATAREFEPIWVREFPQGAAQRRLEVLNGRGRVVASSVSPTDYRFSVEITERSRLRINTFYFPGWRLLVDGVRRPIQISNPQGLMEFSLEPGPHQVRVIFADTPIRFWSTRLAQLSLALLLVTPWLGKMWRSARILRWSPKFVQVARGRGPH